MDTPMLARVMLKMMLEDGYSTVMESELVAFVKTNAGITPKGDEFVAAAEFINSLYPDRKPIIEMSVHEYPADLKKEDEQVFNSNYSTESLMIVLEEIE